MDMQSIQVQALITFVMPLLIQLAKRSQSAGVRLDQPEQAEDLHVDQRRCGARDLDGN